MPSVNIPIFFPWFTLDLKASKKPVMKLPSSHPNSKNISNKTTVTSSGVQLRPTIVVRFKTETNILLILKREKFAMY